MTTLQTRISREISECRVAPGTSQHVNVGDVERIASVAGAGLLGILGLRKGGLAGWTVAALGGALLYRGASGHCALYSSLGHSTAGKSNRISSIRAGRGVKILETVAVNRPAEQLFLLWRDFDQLPRFMSHLISVKADGPRSHWVAHGPVGTRVEWDAEIVNQEHGRLIAWRSLEDSEIGTAGSVHFTPLPGDRGTEVRVVLKYDPPAGRLGSWLAWLFGQEPGQQIREDLRRFKRIVETGELPTTRGQSSGRN